MVHYFYLSDGAKVKNVCYLIVLLFLVNPIISRTYAWIYPEHREMALQGIKKLSPEKRKKLDELWSLARTGHELRLHESVIDETNTISPKFIDFAAWPAIGGDHSVSAKDMLNTVLHSDWILSVASIANELKIALAESWNSNSRNNALRNSDLLLQRADPAYATRANYNLYFNINGIPSPQSTSDLDILLNTSLPLTGSGSRLSTSSSSSEACSV